MSWCPALSEPPGRVHRWLVWPLGVSSSFPPFHPFWSLFVWDLGTLVSVGGLRGSEPPMERAELQSGQGWGKQLWIGTLSSEPPPAIFRSFPAFLEPTLQEVDGTFLVVQENHSGMGPSGSIAGQDPALSHSPSPPQQPPEKGLQPSGMKFSPALGGFLLCLAKTPSADVDPILSPSLPGCVMVGKSHDLSELNFFTCRMVSTVSA